MYVCTHTCMLKTQGTANQTKNYTIYLKVSLTVPAHITSLKPIQKPSLQILSLS